MKINYWGNNNYYHKLFDNNMILEDIFKSCYKNEMTIDEILNKINLPIRYVITAIETLEQYGFIIKKRNKYISNIIMIPNNIIENNLYFKNLITKIYKMIDEYLTEQFNNKKFSELIFSDKSVNKSKIHLYSIILYITIMEKLQLCLNNIPPKNKLGDEGFIWITTSEEKKITEKINICNYFNEKKGIIHIIEHNEFNKKISKIIDNDRYSDIIFEIANNKDASIKMFSKREINDILVLNNHELLLYENGIIKINIFTYDKKTYQNIRLYLNNLTSTLAYEVEENYKKIYDEISKLIPKHLNKHLKQVVALEMFRLIYSSVLSAFINENKFDCENFNNIHISFIELFNNVN